MIDTCVILAAGKGTRMGGDLPKVLIPIYGKPVIQYVVEFWKHQGVKEFVFVVGYKADLVLDCIERLNLKHWTYVLQNEQRGIAHAILQAKPALIGADKFNVALGDCLNIGSFDIPEDLSLGYGIWNDPYLEALNKGCAVTINKNQISSIIEKPSVEFSGMGTYFFDRRVWGYVENQKPSSLRNEIEISHVLQWMIDDGQPLKPVWFNGDFINCTTPDDITYAEKILTMELKDG